ncbi:MAG TPA: ankyrin repeat domain-containing protein [Gemmataceae bacterium]|jgi:hypothetical protein|nr:ankyrin repeat domain-containing protein [Gemmataceae bacterium]
MANAKEEALLRAAQSGSAAKVKQLLAGGAPIEARDVNRKTPVMLAAEGGHVEAFRVLVDAGADLHATAARQLDLLEVAARSGNLEIVRLLLERGLPVNGHWKPVNDAIRKIGHDTPLIQAVDNAEVEVTRLLLEAGADRNAKYQGRTALQLAKERFRDPDFDEQKNEYQAIVALLGEEPANGDSPAKSEQDEVKQFAKNARRPEYVQLRKLLAGRCGEARSWSPAPDHGAPATSVVAFAIAECKRQQAIDDLQEEARKAGCQLVLGEPWTAGEDAALVLFPTDNKLAVIAAVGTEGANYDVSTPNIIAWLATLDEENPFQLTYCDHESVGGTFLRPVKAVKKLAERMVQICPSCLDDGPEDAEELALELKKRKSFFLRWD